MHSPTVLETPCREWQGARNQKGYGVFTRLGRKWYLHRWVWVQANGPIPDDMKVLHRCDNPPCFRYDHLFLGTYGDNNRDSLAKGRARNGDRHRRLTNEEARHIRERVALGTSQGLMARYYRISQRVIYSIVYGHRYKDAGGPVKERSIT